MSLPCHVIYTVPISIQAHLGDIWEQTPEFVPAIRVNRGSYVSEEAARDGRAALEEVVTRRLRHAAVDSQALFGSPELLQRMIDVSGGHISDLLLLVREALLEAQTDDVDQLSAEHVRRSIRNRSMEYNRLLETKHLETLYSIEQLHTSANNDGYRDLIFKRLALEYVLGEASFVAVHPLVAASPPYQAWKGTTGHPTESPR
jgi:hypothetical protein